MAHTQKQSDEKKFVESCTPSEEVKSNYLSKIGDFGKA
jgi:hypothetical protein